jgi:ABC-type Mn2+/Zn2+ transport system ATPase subunit
VINFKKIKWINFLSTGNNPVEVFLDKSPTTLIIGENGAGKSTILMRYVLLCLGNHLETLINPN